MGASGWAPCRASVSGPTASASPLISAAGEPGQLQAKGFGRIHHELVERTAENHLARVYDKLGIRTRAELARALDGGTPALVA